MMRAQVRGMTAERRLVARMSREVHDRVVRPVVGPQGTLRHPVNLTPERVHRSHQMLEARGRFRLVNRRQLQGVARQDHRAAAGY